MWKLELKKLEDAMEPVKKLGGALNEVNSAILDLNTEFAKGVQNPLIYRSMSAAVVKGLNRAIRLMMGKEFEIVTREKKLLRERGRIGVDSLIYIQASSTKSLLQKICSEQNVDTLKRLFRVHPESIKAVESGVFVCDDAIGYADVILNFFE